MRSGVHEYDALCTVPIVSLHQHDLLSDELALFRCTESDHIADARVRLLIGMCDTHTTTDADVEAFQIAALVGNSDEADVIGEDVNVIIRRNGDCDFELYDRLDQGGGSG